MNPAKLFSIDINLVICIAAAWFMELALGSPRFFPRPSLYIARFAKMSADKVLATVERYKKHPALTEKRAGVFLLIYFVLFASVLTAVFLDLAHRVHPSFYYIFNVMIMRGVFNTRAAADKAVAARKTLNGDAADDIRPIIADISKNCLDGVFTPILCASLGVILGIPSVFAAAYKTLSILDGAVGHKAGRYGNIGRAAAKTDDAVNFLPARLCGFIIPLLAPFCGTGARGVTRGFRATRETHAARIFSGNYTSPNDAWPAAAFAGTLGIILGGAGEATGDGKRVINLAEPETKDIGKAVRLMFASSLTMLAACCAALFYFNFILAR